MKSNDHTHNCPVNIKLRVKLFKQISKTYRKVNACLVSVRNGTYNSRSPFPLGNSSYFRLAQASNRKKPFAYDFFSTLVRHSSFQVSILYPGRVFLHKNHRQDLPGMSLSLTITVEEEDGFSIHLTLVGHRVVIDLFLRGHKNSSSLFCE